jgi:hypothetical protein
MYARRVQILRKQYQLLWAQLWTSSVSVVLALLAIWAEQPLLRIPLLLASFVLATYSQLCKVS